jgi:quinoprotein dehydrogenase-associated probable ABC transporter substrate-binding protein
MESRSFLRRKKTKPSSRRNNVTVREAISLAPWLQPGDQNTQCDALNRFQRFLFDLAQRNRLKRFRIQVLNLFHRAKATVLMRSLRVAQAREGSNREDFLLERSVPVLFFASLALCFLSACSHQTVVSPVTAQQPARVAGVLRVCADPNNLPFSNQQLEGFENKLADMIASETKEKLEYTWWAQRRGFFRNTLKAGDCDVVMGVPSGFEMAATTKPYYRSSYVFITRKDRSLDIRSLDDPLLRKLRIGVQMVGDDFSNTPPAHALSRRNIIQNVRGYTLYGDYSQPNPPARIIDAVAAKEVDVAIAWGPLAGYFARKSKVPLKVVPVSPQVDQPFLPFVYDISMGVRRGDQELKDQLEQILDKRRADIDRLLEQYGVPRVDATTVAVNRAGN